MHAATEKKLSSDSLDSTDHGACLEKRCSSENIMLPKAVSQRQAHILNQRYVSMRPLTKYGRMLRCEDPCSGRTEEFQSKAKTGDGVWEKVQELVPVLGWFPAITCQSFRADLIAGLTVGVMVIPQSMSYASIAGLPYIYGMYAACVPALVYALLGQSRQLAVGPVAMVSLLMHTGMTGLMPEECGPKRHGACERLYIDYSILTAAVAGVIQILARLLKLGFLVSFLGHPVASGFTSAAAIIIGLSQLKYMLGYDIEKSEQVHMTLKAIIANLHKTQPMTLCLGIVWFIFLFGSKKLSQRYKKMYWLGPLAPLISCAVATVLLGVCTPLRETFHVDIVGEIPAGLFPPSIKSWHLEDIGKVLPTAVSVCLIGYMESIAIGKNLATRHGYELEPGQELFALGMANFVGAMFSCYPVTGSFSRSAVSNATGAVSQLAGVITGLVMLCTLLFLTPLFYFLPSFVLAAIVISSVIPLVAYGEAMKLWRVKKGDLVLWLAAFVGTLFLGVLNGIGLAILLSLVIVIYETARPQIMILWRVPGTTIYRNVKQQSNGLFIPNVLIARIGSSLYFANASFVRDLLNEYVEALEGINCTKYVILEMTPVVSVDSTAVHVIEDLVSQLRSRDIQVAFAMVGNRVVRSLRASKAMELIGEQWLFPTVNEAVIGCLRHREGRRGHELSGAISGWQSIDAEGEIGASNDLHGSCTTIMLHLTSDIAAIMSDIAAVFERKSIAVSHAEIDTIGDGQRRGVRHVYHVQSALHRGKLSAEEIADLRAELGRLLHGEAAPQKTPGVNRDLPDDPTWKDAVVEV